jgi:hypothetical protein
MIETFFLLFLFFIAHNNRAAANDLAISMNPMRVAQFSYNLLASTITAIIPLAVRRTKNPRDMDALREILAVFNNKLYQAREVFYASVTLGMVQVPVNPICTCCILHT